MNILIADRPIISFQRLKKARIWLLIGAIFAVLFLLAPAQGSASFSETMASFVSVAPFLLLSATVAAYASASGADNLLARAFTGSPTRMILLAALAGSLSPFCSCGVIPLIAALFSLGVPVSAIMAFWLASPVMDPEMFVLTSGILGNEWAVAKTLSALGLGLFGGFASYIISKRSNLEGQLRDGVGNGGCGSASLRAPKSVVWAFWREKERSQRFGREVRKTVLFLTQWLLLAFLLESLMLAYVPAEAISTALGGGGIAPIAIATVVGVPMYLNGYAALPLVKGLLAQGMMPGAGLAFLVAGGVTSIPAAIAVWALVKPRVFALYLALALSGSFLAGLIFSVWS